MPATAVIHVIGLFLLSFQIVPGRLVAVAPRIPCSGPAQSDQRLGIRPDKRVAFGPAEQAMNAMNVEGHTATLLIRASDYISNSEWPLIPVDSNDPTTLYVRLDGEQIRFIPSPIKVKRMRSAAIENESNDLGLPHLGCCAKPQLRPEYMPPDYRLAAAVLDFSGGRAHACDQPYERQDTIVDIDNGGTLTIEATKGGTKKQITVKGGAHLTFQNMPLGSIPGEQACAGSHDHRGAFFAMVKACDEPMPCPKSGKKGNDCSKPLPSIDARCSNNQWP